VHPEGHPLAVTRQKEKDSMERRKYRLALQQQKIPKAKEAYSRKEAGIS